MTKPGPGTGWIVAAYATGAALLAIALLPEFLSGAAPGFGPMQICAVIGALMAVFAGSVLLLRADRAAVRARLLARLARLGKGGAKLALCFGSIALVALAAEAWARWRAVPPDDQRRWLELIGELPEGKQLAADRGEWNNFAKLVYHDYYLYGPAPRKLATSTYTSFFGERPCPDSVADEAADERCWFFGGSTMMNIETTDERTIANNAIKELNRSGVRAAGHNFGTGMFQSCLELAKFQEILRRVPRERRPTLVVFYDGFNDPTCGYYFGAGHMQSDVAARLQMLVEHRHWDMVRVGAIEGLFENSKFYQQYGRWLASQRAALAGVGHDASEENLAQTVAIYQTNMEMVRGICRQFHIRPVLVLQPLVPTKHGRTKDEDELYESLKAGGFADFVEGFYARVRAVMADCPEFVDLSGVLDNDGRTDFYDLGHTGPYTGAHIGKALGVAIRSRPQPAKGHQEGGG